MSCSTTRSRGARGESYFGARKVTCADFQYKTEGENTIKSLKQQKLRETVGPVGVIIGESGVTDSQQNATVGRGDLEGSEHGEHTGPCVSEASPSETSSDTRSEDLCIEYAAPLLNRSQRAAKDNRTAYELRLGKPSTDRATIRRISHVHADCSNATKTKIRRLMESKMDWWNEATCCWLEQQGGVFKVHCITTSPAIQSSDPELVKSVVGTLGIPRLAERHVCWTTSQSQQQNP